MKISNRLLGSIVVVSGISTLVLVMQTPITRRISVYQTTTSLAAGDLVWASSGPRNTSTYRVALGEYAKNVEKYIPEALGGLVDGRRAVRAVPAGAPLKLTDFVVSSNVADTEFYPLSALLAVTGRKRALAIAADAIVTVGWALEPGDVIDLVLPGGQSSQPDYVGIEVLAVGPRSQSGWVATQSLADFGRTVTLAADAPTATRLSRLFLKNSVKPRAILHAKPVHTEQ